MKPISPGRRCCWHAPRATARPPATLPVRRARRTDPLLRRAARRGPPGGGPQLLDGWGHQAPRPTRRAGSAVQAQAAGRSRIGAVAADCSTSAPTAPAHCRVRSRVGARARPPPAGLAAQPLPHRPGRSPTRLRARRAARQRQRRRPPAGHHLAVAPQSVQPPRPGHAHPQPRRRPPAGRRRPPAQRPAGHPAAGPGVCRPQPWRPPRPGTAGGRAAPVGPPRRGVRHPGRQRRRRAEQREPGRKPTSRAWAIRRANRAHRHTSERQGRSERRQADRATRSDRTSRSDQPEERGMVADAR
jgi:hypothetical protein